MAKLYVGLSWLKKTTLVSCIVLPSSVSAQIVPDTTLPQNSKITTEDDTSIINEGSKVGSNLFHSFEEFSIPTGNTAYFNNSLDVQNIISRVTGSSVSEIDGLIRSNGNANFFLLNPNGIIFNTNARIEIGGSFLASTASYLSFADGTQFKTNTNQSAPLLTVTVPVGLGFGSNPEKIIVRGDGQGQRFTSELIDTEAGLQIRSNKTIGFVGGDLELEGGTIKTAGGRVELGSVADPGLVGLNFDENGFSLSYSDISAFGNIRLSQKTVVDASGLGGGNIQVRGRQISLLDSSELYSATLGSEPGDSINIEASESVEISGLASDSQNPSFVGTQVFEENTTGAGGNITITTGKLFVQNGGGIQASTFGEGKAGNLTINAREVEVDILAPLRILNCSAFTVKLPPTPTSSDSDEVKSALLYSFPSRLAKVPTISTFVAFTVRFPAEPKPKVLACICEPSATLMWSVLITKSPAEPLAPSNTDVTILLPNSNSLLLTTPLTFTSLAFIVKFPAFPSPKVLA